jgi:hypothetical protein
MAHFVVHRGQVVKLEFDGHATASPVDPQISGTTDYSWFAILLLRRVR